MRVLIAIGCNAYDHEAQLGGAEEDARRMFGVLLRPELGDYDLSASRLLLSPTIQEIQATFREVLAGAPAIDTFTLFFAGHGGVANGSFYMLVRDSLPGQWSVSALSLSHLFLTLNEVRPAQSNIIIDACESGGLIADLGVLLKPDLLGDEGSPGITLLATAAQNQTAEESDDGGDGTSAILDCIEGRELVQDNEPALDLAEIGRHVSNRLRETTGQSPVVWGLNLYGPPRFCGNPRFGTDPTRPLREVIKAWSPEIDALVRLHYDELWRAYSSTGGSWEARAFAGILDPILAQLAQTPGALAAFIERLAATVLARAQASSDAFRPAQVGATLATCLLPYLQDPLVERQARALHADVGEAIMAASLELEDRLRSDAYALLSTKGGGLADLFYLPLRIASVLGWTAAAGAMFDEADPRRAAADELFGRMLRTVVREYASSVVAISDAQSPAWLVTLARARDLDLVDDGEAIVGLLFHSLLECEGNVARSDIPPEDVFDYLTIRRSGAYDGQLELLERPPELTAVVLMAGAVFGLDETLDPHLWELDGHHFLAYVTDDFGQFGADLIRGGHNLIFAIGEQVFRISDLSRQMNPEIPIPSTMTLAAGAILASLTFPDRCAWFVFRSTIAAE